MTYLALGTTSAAVAGYLLPAAAFTFAARTTSNLLTGWWNRSAKQDRLAQLCKRYYLDVESINHKKITSAFRVQAQHVHPDKTRNPNTTEFIQTCNDFEELLALYKELKSNVYYQSNPLYLYLLSFIHLYLYLF